MSLWLKQSTAVTVKIGPFVDDTDFKTAETALTISQADIRLSKNGGAFAQSNNAAGATHDASGYYGVPLDTTDTGTLGTLRVFVAESGALQVWQDFMVVPANVWDSFFGADLLQVDSTQLLGTAYATPTVAGVQEVDVTHLNGVTQSLLDLKDFADDGYDPATNKVQGVVLADTLTTNNDKTGYTIAAGGIISGAHAAAELNAIADANLDRNMATGTDSGTDSTAVRTPRQALRLLRNKRANVAGVLTCRKEDDVTASWTAAVTTAAGNPTDSIDPT